MLCYYFTTVMKEEANEAGNKNEINQNRLLTQTFLAKAVLATFSRSQL